MQDKQRGFLLHGLLARAYMAYSPDCVEEKFHEVQGSKQPIRHIAKHSTTAWRHPLSVETLRLGSSSCTIVYQGVATRNDATTREILAHRTGPMQIYTTP